MDVNELYIRALKIAEKAHAGQTRTRGAEKGKPYITHPIRVADRLSGLAKVAGVLHDVIEDTGVTENDLRNAGIPEIVLKAVKLLTKQEGDNYDMFICRIIMHGKTEEGRMAIEVKIADIDDNSMSLEEGSLKDKYRLAKRLLLIYREKFNQEKVKEKDEYFGS